MIRFIAERLDKDEVINHLIEFGLEDIDSVFADDDVMYVYDIVAVVLSSVRIALEDEQLPILDAQAATIATLEAANQDLTCRLALASAEVERLAAENKQQRAFLAERLAKTWQPIETETKFDSPWAGPNLIIEEGGDILTMEAKLRGPSVKLPDGVRLCRMVRNG